METFTVEVAPPGPTQYTNITTEDLHKSPQLYFAVRRDFPYPLCVQILVGYQLTQSHKGIRYCMDAHLVRISFDDGTCYVPFLLGCLNSTFIFDAIPSASHYCCTYWISGVLDPHNYTSPSASSDYTSGISGGIV
jgi:hypothetical protein